MFFTQSFLTALAATTAFASPMEKRAVTASQMVANIDQLTKMSQDLTLVANNIDSGNTAISKRQSNPFQPVITGFQDIIQQASKDFNQADGTQPFNAANSKKVCTSYHRFALAHGQLMDVMATKSGLLEGIFLGPVAAVLRSDENVIDTVSFQAIDVAPSCQDGEDADKKTLDEKMGKAICAYTPGGSLGVDLFC